MQLSDEEHYEFDITDLGNLYHEALYQFGNYLTVKGEDWTSYSKETAESFVEDTVEHFATEYRNRVLFDTARNEALKERAKEMLKTTLDSLSYQLMQGDFRPACYELSFRYLANPSLYGKIDRLDIAEDGDTRYVKVLDYKSGSHTFDISRLYYGLDLQLAVYLNAAVTAQKKEYPDQTIVPSACFYYEIADPMPESLSLDNPEERMQAIRKQLRVNGLILEDDAVLEHLDRTQGAESLAVPVKYKKNGELSGTSQTAGKVQFELIEKYADYKVKQIAQSIREGDICISPIKEQAEQTTCRYCAYRSICGFEKKLPGFKERDMELKQDAVYEQMKKELSEHGVYDGSKEGHNGQKS